MKRHTHVALIATLMSVAAWGQEVSVFGTTMAEVWKSEDPGFAKASYTPATQFLGIDATKVGMDNLSLHLFGWGRQDLQDASSFDGTKQSGYLSYAYLQYRFNQANAELKAGRFAANLSSGFEQVDGVSGYTDLVNGFNISGFAGRPVLFKTVDPRNQHDYDRENDIIVGSRLGWRLSKVADIGVSYLQSGFRAPQDLRPAATVNYTRRELGFDVNLVPTSAIDLRGRTVLDMADQHSNVAEHDYVGTLKFSNDFTVAGTFTERNFAHYFVGTTMPSLFRQDTNDVFRAAGTVVTWNLSSALQAVADYRHTHRQTYGYVNRGGAELRWASEDKTLLMGASGHFANAEKTRFVDATAPWRSLSYGEARAWVMATRGKFTTSLDAIVHRYRQSNPYVAGPSQLHETVASVGYQISEHTKVSADLSHASTPAARNETRALLRAEYRFGMSSKGGH